MFGMQKVHSTYNMRKTSFDCLDAIAKKNILSRLLLNGLGDFMGTEEYFGTVAWRLESQRVFPSSLSWLITRFVERPSVRWSLLYDRWCEPLNLSAKSCETLSCFLRWILGDEFARHTGYNEVGELNDIIIVYPQAVADTALNNAMGCWDFYGYTSSYYSKCEISYFGVICAPPYCFCECCSNVLHRKMCHGQVLLKCLVLSSCLN